MSRDEFTRLFTYMENRFNKIEAELAKKADAEPVHKALDAILKRLDIDDHERLAMRAQCDRHETLIKKRL